ncbi:hypothetical protein ColTof4_14097 [Colletotrichum tofieldiae]|uniref:Uncharacterized protein n=1 Tax=Colletotrichum tofieldiae TaxID=708197 RepID=A0A166WK21_9PEZI|nr:hypothetical protein CT0861_05345 [Colletotrichum tofieldiae]GKT55648.1 hypothetical protein ColTof3_02987 [Colletotrichum tofieldiae]GKT81674.1 hypothetical protein ColTof4_14097 [Colletotrichum tofieldiae]GKT82692.1 hypothetical protein Ct61P_00542 [Colletotrichum tofieldiae]
MSSAEDSIELMHRRGGSREEYHDVLPGFQNTPGLAVPSPGESPLAYPRSLSLTAGFKDEETSSIRPLLSHQYGSLGETGRDSEEQHTPQAGAYAPKNKTPSDTSSSNQHESKPQPTTAGTRGTPKPVTRRGWKRFTTGWLIHLPALVATIALVVVSNLRLFWYSEEGIKGGPKGRSVLVPANVVNNILQVPAKVHEILIIASLASISLAMFRRRLMSDGVRLGFLTGGYRVGDLAYLFSPAFKRQGIDLHRPWELLLAGFVVFATIMSTIVGPASAVLLVPTLGWYPLDHQLAFSDVIMPLTYYRSPNFTWPARLTEINAGLVNMRHCKGVSGLYQHWCPAGGYTDIWNWVQSFGSTDLRDSLSFHFPSTDLRRELVFTQSNSWESDSITLSTTPSQFLMVSLGLFRDYIDHEYVGAVSSGTPYRLTTKPSGVTAGSQDEYLRQPFVQSKCKVYEKEEIDTAQFPMEHLNCFEDADCLSFQKEPPFPVKSATWLDDPGYDSRITTSRYYTLHNDTSVIFIAGRLPEENDRNLVYACNFVASWVAANFTVDPKISDTLNSTLNQEEAIRGTFQSSHIENGSVIRFDKDWLEYLTPGFLVATNRTVTSIGTLVNLFVDRCDSSNGNVSLCFAPVNSSNIPAAEVFLSKVFGIYLTDSLARTGSQAKTNLRLSQSRDELLYIWLNDQYGSRSGVYNFTTFNETHTLRTWRNGELYVNWTIEYMTEVGVFADGLPIDFDVEWYGYGTGQQRKTLHFALAMMYIYLGIVALYALSVGSQHVLEFLDVKVRQKRFRVLSVVPWSDLQDLVVLALKTPPPYDEGLVDAGAGVTSKDVWSQVVRVRADDQRNIHLVSEDSAVTEKLDETGSTYYF